MIKATLAIISFCLCTSSLSAFADDELAIARVKKGFTQFCNGIQDEFGVIAPAHCFSKGIQHVYLYQKVNPIKASKVIKANRPNANVDLVELGTVTAISKPPKGEISQRGLSCLTYPLQPPLYLHSCMNMHAGQSGTIIINNNIRLMHLGLIKINGQWSGFGIEYPSIIYNIRQTKK